MSSETCKYQISRCFRVLRHCMALHLVYVFSYVVFVYGNIQLIIFLFVFFFDGERVIRVTKNTCSPQSLLKIICTNNNNMYTYTKYYFKVINSKVTTNKFSTFCNIILVKLIILRKKQLILLKSYFMKILILMYLFI